MCLCACCLKWSLSITFLNGLHRSPPVHSFVHASLHTRCVSIMYSWQHFHISRLSLFSVFVLELYTILLIRANNIVLNGMCSYTVHIHLAFVFFLSLYFSLSWEVFEPLTNHQHKPNNTFRWGVDLSENPNEREWLSSNYRFRITTVKANGITRLPIWIQIFWNQSVRMWAGISIVGGSEEDRNKPSKRKSRGR